MNVSDIGVFIQNLRFPIDNDLQIYVQNTEISLNSTFFFVIYIMIWDFEFLRTF